MADIFISYSHKDRDVARGLADFLDGSGYSVWWDYELVGGTKYRKEIKAQLDLAKAAIVIWTADSVESEYVIDEAEDAKSQGKLIPTRDPELEFKYIPMGFRQFQTDPVTKPDLILKALDEHKVVPSRPPMTRGVTPVDIGPRKADPVSVAAADEIANWEFVKASQSPKAFRDYLVRFPNSPYEEPARVRIAKLEEERWQQIANSQTPAALVGFLTDFPDGRYFAQVQRTLMGLESDEWTRISNADDSAVFERFLQSFPNGHLAGEARHRLQQLRQAQAEAKVWTDVTAKPTRAGLEGYIASFPLGQHVTDARRLLSEVVTTELRISRWSEIKGTGYVEQLRAFLKDFKDGPEVQEAQVMLAARMREREDRDWQKVADARHPAPVLQFLEHYPEGERRAEALQLLKAMPKLALDEATAVAGSSKSNIVQQGMREWQQAAVGINRSLASAPTPRSANPASNSSELGRPYRDQPFDHHSLLSLTGREEARPRFGAIWVLLVTVLVAAALAAGGMALAAIASFNSTNRFRIQEMTALFVALECGLLLLALLVFTWRHFVLARKVSTSHPIPAVLSRHILGIGALVAVLAATQAIGTAFHRYNGGIDNILPNYLFTGVPVVVAFVLVVMAALMRGRAAIYVLAIVSIVLGGVATLGVDVGEPVATDYFLTRNLIWWGGAAILAASVSLAVMVIVQWLKPTRLDTVDMIEVAGHVPPRNLR